MKTPSRNALIRVLDSDESRRWHGPMRAFREFFQEQLVAEVEDEARRSGAAIAYVFDAGENLQWRSG